MMTSSAVVAAVLLLLRLAPWALFMMILAGQQAISTSDGAFLNTRITSSPFVHQAGGTGDDDDGLHEFTFQVAWESANNESRPFNEEGGRGQGLAEIWLMTARQPDPSTLTENAPLLLKGKKKSGPIWIAVVDARASGTPRDNTISDAAVVWWMYDSSNDHDCGEKALRIPPAVEAPGTEKGEGISDVRLRRAGEGDASLLSLAMTRANGGVAGRRESVAGRANISLSVIKIDPPASVELFVQENHPNDGLVYLEFRIVGWAPVDWDVKRRRKLSVCVLGAATAETSACSEYESVVATGSGGDGSAHADELEGTGDGATGIDELKAALIIATGLLICLASCVVAGSARCRHRRGWYGDAHEAAGLPERVFFRPSDPYNLGTF